ncbi:MAG: hypothetical protein KC546_20520, partial [Anaerolineae bacterium]|nr:hypothetical protein [Anaerolineae bacterium]
YYAGIDKAQKLLESQSTGENRPLFEPARSLPPLSNDLCTFYEPAKMRIVPIGEYKGISLKLFDLAMDPTTNTTKTLPSLLMIGRAIQHIRSTGENLLILVTTSGNKGTALRSAVERAIRLGLVTKEQLRIVTIVPKSSTHKLRASGLTSDPELAVLNPIAVYQGESSAKLKLIGSEFQKRYSDQLYANSNTRIWYSLNLDNYRVADAARAYYEYEYLAKTDNLEADNVRLHVHSVSSAYGFLGYHLGRSVLVNEGVTRWASNPGYFLVQHLQTSDMVLHTYYGDFDRQNMPTYTMDDSTGIYKQGSDIHFPLRTLDPNENLDATFYTKEPPTAPTMSKMIRQFGGGGIVVSLLECMDRYPLIRAMLKNTGIDLPGDPRKITEWALIMAMTGVMEAIDRQIIAGRTEITIQSSGFYVAGTHYEPLCENTLPSIDDHQPFDALERLVNMA